MSIETRHVGVREKNQMPSSCVLLAGMELRDRGVSVGQCPQRLLPVIWVLRIRCRSQVVLSGGENCDFLCASKQFPK